VRLYGVCTVRFVESDCMVCVLFGVLSATLWCGYCSVCLVRLCGVYFSVCLVRLYGMCTLRCVECDCMVCVLFGMLSASVCCVYISMC